MVEVQKLSDDDFARYMRELRGEPPKPLRTDTCPEIGQAEKTEFSPSGIMTFSGSTDEYTVNEDGQWVK